MKLYRIQRLKDGLFLTGLTNPSHTKQGKFFKSKIDIRKFLEFLRSKMYYGGIFLDAKTKYEIVEYNLEEGKRIDFNALRGKYLLQLTLENIQSIHKLRESKS